MHKNKNWNFKFWINVWVNVIIFETSNAQQIKKASMNLHVQICANEQCLKHITSRTLKILEKSLNRHQCILRNPLIITKFGNRSHQKHLVNQQIKHWTLLKIHCKSISSFIFVNNAWTTIKNKSIKEAVSKHPKLCWNISHQHKTKTTNFQIPINTLRVLAELQSAGWLSSGGDCQMRAGRPAVRQVRLIWRTAVRQITAWWCGGGVFARNKSDDRMANGSPPDDSHLTDGRPLCDPKLPDGPSALQEMAQCRCE